MAYQLGSHVVFGAGELQKPIIVPPGYKWRLRMRVNEFVKCYLYGPDGCSQWLLLDKGDHYEPAYKQAENRRER